MLSGLPLATLVCLLIAGVALDAVFGELPVAHPLVGFGRYAVWLERHLNHGRILPGFLAWMLAVLPFVALSACLLRSLPQPLALALHALLLYFSLGLRSLREHCMPIAHALREGDLSAARRLTARIVSRDTGQADEADLSRAAVESLLENGNDAVFGTLFWFLAAGGPGALLFRLANTLDAMWGYRTERYLHFGRFAARCDDVLNWIPARLTALSYLALGNARGAWRCWRNQALHWPSPNAGPVTASGAGALQVALGGMASYDGVVEMRPPLGEGREAHAGDIPRAWQLVWRAVLLWCLLAAISAWAVR
ncbi:MAG: cobalamin biosynthesis protein [Burkholderiaceae bacterium]|nr:cobalamin biosynthesis protein [Burkholderiaceae bacterium]